MTVIPTLIAANAFSSEFRIGRPSVGRTYSESPSLVRCSANDGAFRLPSHEHGLTTQLRIIALLDRGIERIHIDMYDFSHDLLKLASCAEQFARVANRVRPEGDVTGLEPGFAGSVLD
jgi:hypothetical protein